MIEHSWVGQAGLETGDKLRFLHIRDHQSVFGPCDGHVDKPRQPVFGLVRGNDPLRAHQVDQVEVQAFGAVDAYERHPIGGEVEELLGPDVLGDLLGGDTGRFQLLEQAGGGFRSLIFEVIGPVDLVVVEDPDFRTAVFTSVKLLPDILDEIVFQLAGKVLVEVTPSPRHLSPLPVGAALGS